MKLLFHPRRLTVGGSRDWRGCIAVSRVVSIEKKRRHEFWVHLDSGERVGASRNLDELEEKIGDLP